MNLKNKIVLLTGGSTGIGEAIAKDFIKHGAKIIVFGLHKPNYKCDFYKMDLRNENEIKEAFEKIKKIDVVVNNSGVAKILSLGQTTTELFDEIGAHIQQKGYEFGTTTGRSRRCGWLDVPAVKYGARITGVNSIALMKLDVLDELKEIKICVGYKADNKQS